MPLNLSIRADVVNILADQPKPADSFLVDSNVWLFLAYTRSAQGNNPPLAYQVHRYPSYVNKALQAKARVLRSGLALAEIAHVIERTEHEIWTRNNATLKFKEYRHNMPDQRENVIGEVESAWFMVKTISIGLDITVDGTLADSALALFKSYPLDGYDILMSAASRQAGVLQIITDDCDFACVAGIQVFTANRSVLEQAKEQGRLLLRS